MTYLKASSVLQDAKIADRYSADRAFDGDPLTAWVEAKDDRGIGERIEMKIDRTISADAVEVMPGYFDQKWYAANNRVKALKVELAGGTTPGRVSFLIAFQDQMVAQRKSFGTQTFDTISFEIADTFAGERWNDTCIAEIALYYQGRLVTPRIGGDSSGAAGLLESARDGDVDAVKRLLAAGADLEQRDEVGGPPLMAAAWGGHREIVKALIAAGSDVNAKGMAGGTALMAAAGAGHGEVVEALVKAGATLDARDEDGHTALELAVSQRRAATVLFLLSRGADGWVLYHGAGGGKARPNPASGGLRPGFSKLSFGWSDNHGSTRTELHGDGRASGTIDHGISGEDRFYGIWWIESGKLHLDFVTVGERYPSQSGPSTISIERQQAVYGVSGPNEIYREYEDAKGGTRRMTIELDYQD